eukprot:28224-Chlamydomonas_euryale.AAC.17
MVFSAVGYTNTTTGNVLRPPNVRGPCGFYTEAKCFAVEQHNDDAATISLNGRLRRSSCARLEIMIVFLISMARGFRHAG